MAIAGLGLALLPEFLAARPMRDGRLISAIPHATPSPYAISAVYPYTHHVSPKVRCSSTTSLLPSCRLCPGIKRCAVTGSASTNRTIERVPFAA